MKPLKTCDMRGFLSFLLLEFLSRRHMSGIELAGEFERIKGCRPNPGTLYPALKKLKRLNAIKIVGSRGKEKVYGVTPLGRRELEAAIEYFSAVFCETLCRNGGGNIKKKGR